MSKKTIGKFAVLPFNLINLAKAYLLDLFLSFIRDFKMPLKLISLFHKYWPTLKPFLKPFIVSILWLSKRVTSRPFMRAMSTVDHKRIRVMYLIFSLFARIMRV